MQIAALRESIARQWNGAILETLKEYIRIPSKSPAFDPEWESAGHIEAALQLLADWCKAQPIDGMHIDVQRLPGLTPILIVDVPGELADCVLFYGHLDKQPECGGWREGLGPWLPVVREERLFGRGGADDGYSVFSALSAIVALKRQSIPLARCVILIEASEESGSIHLAAHLQALGATIGSPSLVVCLDAECGNYEQLWCTQSLRGCLDGQLRVRVLSEGLHSGLAGGIVPAPFRVVTQLLARIEDIHTGELTLCELRAEVPDHRRAQIEAAACVLGDTLATRFPFVQGAAPVSNDPTQLLLNNTWRATMAVIGAAGLPDAVSAGNVLLPDLTLRLSFRLPPTCDPPRAAAAVRSALEHEPPYGVEARFEATEMMMGWNGPPLASWLEESLACTSRRVFSRDAVHIGCGGTIPFLGLLERQFPTAQFFVTGVLGPNSNAHGPNEFLQLDYVQDLSTCLALVLADHAVRTETH